MTSHEVKKYYENQEIDKLYKLCEKYFNIIDEWADRFFGDLLSEYELKHAQQQLNSAQTKLNPVAGAFEALLVEYENNYIVEEENKIEGSLRVQDSNHCKAVARSKVSDLRRYASDFTRYVMSAQNSVVTVQSLLKRQTIEKANKELDYTGEITHPESSGNKPSNWIE